MTRDDSYVQALVDQGLIAPEEAQNHPQRNIILSSFHGGEADLPTVAAVTPAVGDRWILCSDGLTDYLPESDVHRAVASGSPSAAATAAVALALEAGTRDNVTVLVCDVAEGTPSGDDPVFYGSAADRFTEELGTATA
jgi:serine/threonine protein phosphatase PrpC